MIPHEIIEPFSDLWFLSNLITISLIFFSILYGRLFLKTFDQRLRFGVFLGCILLARAIITHPYQLYLGKWAVESSLPLHLCGISSIISFIVLFRFNQFLYEFLILLGIPGAIQALVTPEFTLGIDNFFLVEYFISHGGIILSGLYLTFVLGHKPRIGSWKRVVIYAQILVFIVHIINIYLNSNYIYTRIKPIVDNPLIVGEHPYYYLGFEVIALINIILFYYLFIKISNKFTITSK